MSQNFIISDIFEVFKDEAGNVWQAIDCADIQYIIDEEDKSRLKKPQKKEEYFKNPPIEVIEDEEVYILNYDEF